REQECMLLYERETARAGKMLRAGHPYVAIVLYNWAKHYPYGSIEVEPLLTRALAILDKIHADDIRSVELIDFLGMFYQSRGRYAQAEAIFKRAVAITEKAKDSTLPYVLGQLAELYKRTGRIAEAVALRQRVVALSEKQYG